jgi:hypothetical protein
MRIRTAICCTTNALLLAGALGCVRRQLPPPVEPSPPSRGKVAYEFIADPSIGKPQNKEHREFVTPRPERTLALPSYPERPLVAKAPSYTVVVRIVIDTEGRVSSVADSQLAPSTAGAFAADFREAVDTAVRRWRFLPGHIDQLEDGDDIDDDGKPDYVRVVESDLVPVFYDVRFDFEIVDGRGRVNSTAPQIEH